MPYKIYLSPSSQYGNPYSYGGANEGDTMYSLAQIVEPKLLKCGFDTMLDGKNLSITQRAKNSNDFQADLHVCFHTNAGGGHGTVMFTWQNSGKSYEIAKSVGNAVASITQSKKLDIRPNPELYEIRGTQAVCCYCEIEFHDNEDGAKWILENLTAIADAIARGICLYFGVQYNPDTDASGNIYRVQVGAFTVKENADRVVKRLSDFGYDSFIINQSSMYKVQCGAFTVKANAENRKNELIMKGFDAIIY